MALIISSPDIMRFTRVLSVFTAITIVVMLSLPMTAPLNLPRIPLAQALENSISSAERRAPSFPTGGAINGAHRGAGIGVLKNAVETMIEILLGEELGTFSRDSYPVTDPPPPPPVDFPIFALSPELKDLICRAKIMTDRHPDLADSIPFVSSIISTHIDVPLGTVNAALTTEGFCDAFIEARREGGVVTATVEPLKFTIVSATITVDKDGIPVSSVPAWNACIRGTIHRDATGNPFTCRNFHSGSKWYHPDLPGFEFTWNMRRKTMSEFPAHTEFIVLNESNEADMLRLAKEQSTIAWAHEEAGASKDVETTEEIISGLYKQCAAQVFAGADRDTLAVCRTYDRLKSTDSVL